MDGARFSSGVGNTTRSAIVSLSATCREGFLIVLSRSSISSRFSHAVSGLTNIAKSKSPSSEE